MGKNKFDKDATCLILDEIVEQANIPLSGCPKCRCLSFNIDVSRVWGGFRLDADDGILRDGFVTNDSLDNDSEPFLTIHCARCREIIAFLPGEKLTFVPENWECGRSKRGEDEIE